MKKIILGKGLEERNANCNFCGEMGKECVKSSVPLEFLYTKYEIEMGKVVDSLKFEMVIKDYDLSFFSDKKYFVNYDMEYATKDYKYKHIIKDTKTEIVKKDADICKDCIKQLAKLV